MVETSVQLNTYYQITTFIAYYFVTIILGALISIFMKAYLVSKLWLNSVYKSCHWSKCVMESLFIKCIYCSKSYMLRGIYRHPNGNVKHFLTDLKNALTQIYGKYTALISGAGDINIELIKFNLEDNYQYVSNVVAYGYLPYITLPTPIRVQCCGVR